MDLWDPVGDSPSTAEDRRASRSWVRRHPVVTAILVLVVLLVAAVWIGHDQAERALERRIAAIRARGEPVTVQDMLSSQQNIPDEENMIKMLAAAARPTQTTNRTGLPYVGNASLPPTGVRWPDATLKASEAYLARAVGVLNNLHKALDLEQSFVVVNWSTPANVPFSQLSELRRAAMILILESQLAAQLGRQEKAEVCMIEMLPLMRKLDGGNVILSALVQIGYTAIMKDAIERTINSCGLGDVTLRELQAALQRAESVPNMKQAFIGERVIFLDTIQWERSSGAATGVAMTAQGCESFQHPWNYIPVLPALDIAAGLDHYERILNALSSPNEIEIQKVGSLDAGLLQIPRYCIMSRILMPSLSHSIVVWIRTVGSNRALRAAIAAERFRLANGTWPVKLDALVPKYLDAVPLDPIDGKPIRYAIIPEGIKTWTISDDDKNEDNGGDVKRLERRNPANEKDRPKDWGWIILNPSLRNRPAPSTSQPTTLRPATRSSN